MSDEKKQRTESALRESEKRFRATFEQAAVGVAHSSLDGRLLLMNHKLCDIVGAPILLARDDDGQVRAFYNACRHRGAPVVRGECGQARMLVCQFHSWGYDLEGQLRRVPEERDFVGLDRAERGLMPVRCEQWGGCWFVNLDPAAMPLLDWLHPLPTLLDDVARSPLRQFHSSSVELGCNWKVLAEGFLEVYHARTVHPLTVARSCSSLPMTVNVALQPRLASRPSIEQFGAPPESSSSMALASARSTITVTLLQVPSPLMPKKSWVVLPPPPPPPSLLLPPQWASVAASVHAIAVRAIS